jgi:type III pantothenate kinase
MKERAMLLAIDIGNTHTVLGGFLRGKLAGEARFTSNRDRTEDELWIAAKTFLDDRKVTPKQVEGVVIASVVPALTDAYRQMAAKYLGAEPLIVSSKLDLGVTIHYADPATLGADRICTTVAAFKKYGGPAIVVDFGTATTYDVISKQGDFLGGVIAPGVETAAAELIRRTAQLPAVELRFPPAVLGTDTRTSIQSGVLFGAVEGSDGLIRRIKRLAGKHAIVIATGGHAKLMAEMSHEIRYVQPSLVLEGARLIYERVRRKKK